MTDWQDPEAVRFMLDDCETWAVVGLSGDPTRTAYSIAQLLQDRGKRIVPVHPDAPTVLGEQGYASLAEIPFPVDVVDVFRRSEAAGQFADQAVAIGAKRPNTSVIAASKSVSGVSVRPRSHWRSTWL